MERTPRTILIRTIGVLILVAILIFGYSRFRGYLKGPVIGETNLNDYETVDTESVPFEGIAINTKEMLVNGRNITFTDQGHFSEVIPLSSGINHIGVVLTDPFGRSEHYQYTIYSTATNPLYEKSYRAAEEKIVEDTIDDQATESEPNQQI